MNNEDLKNQNQDDFAMQDPSIPAYSARGTQNLNQAPTAPQVQPVQNAAVVQASIPTTTEDTTQEALFVDLTADGGQQAEVITDIKKEGVIVDDVQKEHIAPDMNQFLATEQGTTVPQATVEPQINVQSIPVQEVQPVVVSQTPIQTSQNPAQPEVNPYTHEVEYENKFAGMFANQGGGDPALQGSALGGAQLQERPVLTPPPQRKPVKQKGISMGTLLLLLLFIGGMLFVMFLPQISNFLGGF